MTILLSFLTFGPYHLARLTAAQALGQNCGVTVEGLAMSRRDREYAWDSQSPDSLACASGDIPLGEVRASDWTGYLEPLIDSINPDVCAIAGYSHPAMLSLIAICAKRAIPWILMSDSREVDLPRTKWREWSKARIVKLAASGFAAGRTHIDYLEKLGLKKESCSVGYDVVDNSYFASESLKWRSHITSNGDHNGSPRPRYFLACNRFIPKKNLFRLLEAFALYHKDALSTGKPPEARWNLCLLGDGELRSPLMALCHSLGLTVIESSPWEVGNAETAVGQPATANGPPLTAHCPPPTGTVFFPGFRQIAELPRFYGGAEALIHASTTEQWGLVVNEAMASNLPVIVSNQCGCAQELVWEGENGFTFNPLQVEELAELMIKMAAMKSSGRAAMGEAGKTIIANWGLERFAKGLNAAAEKALESGAKPITPFDLALLYFLTRR